MSEKIPKKVAWEVVDEPRQKTNEKGTLAEASIDDRLNVTDVEIKELTPPSPSEERAESQSDDTISPLITPTETQPEEVIELTPISPPKKSTKEIAAELEVRTREYNKKPWEPGVRAAFERAKKASEDHRTEFSNGNYYEALGLSPEASVEGIVGTLNRRAAEFNAKSWNHPHAQEDHDSDRRIAEVLLDDKKRAQYDKDLSEAAAARAVATVAEARHKALHNSMYEVEDVSPKREKPPKAPEDTRPLILVETKPGLATELEEEAPPKTGREIPQPVIVDEGPLEQVETKKMPDEAVAHEQQEDRTFHHSEIGELSPHASLTEYFDLDDAVKESIASGDIEAQRIAMGRLDTFMIEQREGIHIDEESTPKEWRDKLRGLIDSAKEKLDMNERIIGMKEYLTNRSAELDTQVKELGAFEKYFRTKGEQYNKLPLKYKIAVGVLLGVGAVATSGVSVLAPAICMTGIATQRSLGMAGVFIKMEKYLQSKTENIISKREATGAALVSAAGLSILGGYAIKQGIDWASNTDVGHSLQDFVRNNWPFSHSEVSVQIQKESVPSPKVPASASEVPKPMAVAASAPEQVASAPEAAPAATAPAHATAPESAGSAAQAETPAETADKPAAAAAAGGDAAPQAEVKPGAPVTPEAVTVDVSEIKPVKAPGHGYEYMMKRLWEQLQEKHIKLPANSGDTSDLARLLAADEKSINSIVHKLAEEKGWYKPDGTSVRIDLDSAMTINPEGEISVGDHVSAPDEAPVTPAYHAEAETSHTSEVTEGKYISIDDEVRQRAREFVAPLESTTPLSEPPRVEGVSSQTIPEVQATPTYEAPVSNEAPPTNPESTVISNVHNIRIQTAEAHIYENDTKSLFVYGGSPEEKAKMIKEYLRTHQDAVIYAEGAKATRVPWYLTQGVIITEGQPVSEKSFFGIFSTLMKAPSPDDLEKFIK